MECLGMMRATLQLQQNSKSQLYHQGLAQLVKHKAQTHSLSILLGVSTCALALS